MYQPSAINKACRNVCTAGSFSYEQDKAKLISTPSQPKHLLTCLDFLQLLLQPLLALSLGCLQLLRLLGLCSCQGHLQLLSPLGLLSCQGCLQLLSLLGLLSCQGRLQLLQLPFKLVMAPVTGLLLCLERPRWPPVAP